MKLNLKSTIAAPAGQTLNGIVGNTRRGIQVDQALDPDSNNPIANKAVSTTLAALAGKIDAALQKPTGLTKTKLVGVGTNGQENIEIGDNLTLANGKLSASVGGSGGDFDIITIKADNTYTGTITGTKPLIFLAPEMGIDMMIPEQIFNLAPNNAICYVPLGTSIMVFMLSGGEYEVSYTYDLFNHFITMTYSSSNIALYLTIQTTTRTQLTAETLATYFADKKVLANGNLHGVVPTYIAGESGKINIYYMTPGDSNINPTPDEYQDLSSFTISDLVSPVE